MTIELFFHLWEAGWRSGCGAERCGRPPDGVMQPCRKFAVQEGEGAAERRVHRPGCCQAVSAPSRTTKAMVARAQSRKVKVLCRASRTEARAHPGRLSVPQQFCLLDAS